MNRLLKAKCAMACLAVAWTLVLLVPALAGEADDSAASPFNGEDLNGWTTLAGEPVSQGWEVVAGVIHRKDLADRAGHIITEVEFGDFDLSFEFKIAARGNSGLKYRVGKFAGATLGCEYQILDDQSFSHERPTKNTTGSLYDVYEPNAEAFSLKPDGEFNSARIVVQGNQIQHWLNGQLIVSATVGDLEWDRRIAESKFSDVEGFGRNRFGRIMLTDHGSEVWYRNFRLQPIDASPQWLANSTVGGFGRSCNPVRNTRRSPFSVTRYCRRAWFRRR